MPKISRPLSAEQADFLRQVLRWRPDGRFSIQRIADEVVCLLPGAGAPDPSIVPAGDQFSDLLSRGYIWLPNHDPLTPPTALGNLEVQITKAGIRAVQLGK